MAGWSRNPLSELPFPSQAQPHAAAQSFLSESVAFSASFLRKRAAQLMKDLRVANEKLRVDVRSQLIGMVLASRRGHCVCAVIGKLF